ncbi:MAG: 2-phosphosulfolactate phosphatase [Candidatus Binataceae bacterium]
MPNTVVIDCFPEHVTRYRRGYAVVAVDVVRATTTAITAVAAGYRCFPAPTLAAALARAGSLDDVLLAGEQRGLKPPGFDLDNSPTEVLALGEIGRPIVLLSSSGTALCYEASQCEAGFLACLRNYTAVVSDLAGRFERVAIVGAGSRGEFREEDQLCCAWVAAGLMALGYTPQNSVTLDIIRHWGKRPADAWLGNKSAAYLKNSGQLADLEFILTHVADLDACFTLSDGEVTMAAAPLPSTTADSLRKGMYGA